jgi:MFS family permease
VSPGAWGARLRLGLLAGAPDFRNLFLATLVSSVGTWLAVVALVIDVYDRTQDARWVSALLIVEFLPIIAVGLFAAPLVDRLPRRSILIGADVARMVVFMILPFATSALQVVLLAAVAGVATSFFRPAQYAGLPNLVRDAELARANGLIQSAENITVALGPLAGGILVAAVGADPAYWLNAVSFAASAYFVLKIRGSLEEERRESRGHWQDLAEGYALIRRSRALLTVLIAWSLVMLANAGINVAEVVLAKEVFDAGDFGYGLLVAAAGVGLVTGSLMGGGLLERRGISRPYPVAILVMAVGFGAAAAAPNVWVAVPCVAVGGFGNGLAVICNALLVQRGAPDRVRGRVFTVLMSSGYAILGAGMVAAGPLTNTAGARTVWWLAAGFCAAGALAAFVFLHGHEPTAAPALDALEPASTR